MWCNDNIYWYMQDTIIKSYILTEVLNDRADDRIKLRWWSDDWLDWSQMKAVPQSPYSSTLNQKGRCLHAFLQMWKCEVNTYNIWMYYVVQYIVYVCVTSICIYCVASTVDWMRMWLWVTYALCLWCYEWFKRECNQRRSLLLNAQEIIVCSYLYFKT